MKRPLIILANLAGVALCAVSMPGAETAAPPEGFPGVLRWNDGDTIQGEVVAGTDTELSWKAPLFDTPLSVKWSALARIDHPLPAKAAPEAFGFVLRDGGYLLGDLVGINEETVLMHSSRYGEVAIKRAEVVSIRRLRGKNLLWAGPSGTVGWEPATVRNSPKRSDSSTLPIAPLVGGPGGVLTLPYFNRGATLGLDLPERVEIEFLVRASARPDFQFALTGDPKKDNLRIETWEDELVLVAGDQFVSVRPVKDDERTVGARVCWDRKTRRCAVFTPDGQPLADWQVPETRTNDHAGLALQNKGRDLSLESLRVGAWNGDSPTAVDPQECSVEVEDGRVLHGPHLVAADGNVTLQPAASSEAATTVSLADLDAIYLPATASKPAQPPAVFSFADGTFLPEEIVSIKDGAATLKTSFTDTPLNARLGGVTQLRIKAPSDPGTPLEQMDQLTFEKTTLHGQVVCAGGSTPLWLPDGGTRPAALSKTVDAEIKRTFPAGAKIDPAPALFYTSAGDVLPGRLHAIDRTGVEIESDVVALKKLPADGIDAIQFGTLGQMKITGFNDPSWEIIKGDAKTVTRTGEGLKMEPDTSLGNHLAMQSSELTFNVESRTYCTVRMRLFTAGNESKGATSLLLMITGNRVYSGIEAGDNQLQDRVQTEHGSGPMAVKLVISDSAVDLYLDGAWTQTCRIDYAKRPGGGLIIEPSSLWGNQVQPISVSHFEATLKPGQVPIGSVNPEARTEALTVPRFLKDDQPRQALLAFNGDVLRGEIEGTTKTHLGFRSGLETLDVPLDRIEAAIWLKKPLPVVADAGKSPPAAGATILDQVMSRQVKLQNVDLRGVVNFLKQAVPELVLKLPEKYPIRSVRLEIGGTTIGKVLDQICTAFEMSYHLAPDGSVVLEPGKSAKSELVQRVYWLTNKAFSAEGAAQETLAAKGIAFPTGASAAWRADTGLLTVTNTPANQERLEEVLGNDFGGVAAPPTHWLTLLNGGRLGLAVDRFDADAVVGRHPWYGACRIPMAEVYVIQTSAPPPSPAGRALRDWRLVLAPEPVLPEAGGDNSALLGTEAKPFKVPLLDGGEFELAKEKGKVVVLDFWATWCGPCIQSLPGTISAVAGFPEDRVRLVALNQSEPAEQVKRFVETRGWKLNVALDAGAKVGHLYGADAIPLTVIVGPDGKIAWVKTGATSDGEAELTTAIKKLLDPPASPASAPAATMTAAN